MIRPARTALTVVVFLGVAGLGLVAGTPTRGATASTDSAVGTTPHNKEVAIFNEYGAYPPDVKFLSGLQKKFEAEGYDVRLFSDPTETGEVEKGNTATFTSFASLGKAATVIIDTHGIAPGAQTGKKCKGLTTIIPLPGGAIASPSSPSSTTTSTTTATLPDCEFQPMLQVEWAKNEKVRHDKYVAYLKAGINPDDIAAGRADTFLVDKATGKKVYRHVITMTYAGIEHFFGAKHVDFVDSIACFSDSVSEAFHAREAFGYQNETCGSQSLTDGMTLFNRMFGMNGASLRTSSAAYAAGGFDPDFKETPQGDPVVFSPAVLPSSTLNEGGTLKRGGETPVTVHFDASMHRNNGIASIKGCDGSVVSPNWTDDSTFTFKVKVPEHPSTTSATVRLAAPSSTASGGYAAELDGNTDPSKSNGQPPNRDDYTVHVKCTQGIGISLFGSADGFNLQGEVGGAGSRVTCQNLGAGQVLEVQWQGAMPDGTSVAGDFSIKPPGGSLGPGGSANGTMTLELFPGKPPKEDHTGGAGGGQFGTGSGTITTTSSGGTINAVYDNGVKVTGSWTC